MLFEKLTEDNYEHYAAKHYKNNKALSMEDFYEDLLRTKYIKRIFTKYKDTGDLSQARLLLNHVTIFVNMFGVEAGKNMLLFKMDEWCKPSLKTIFIFLNYITQDEMVEIPLDNKLIDFLRDI